MKVKVPFTFGMLLVTSAYFIVSTSAEQKQTPKITKNSLNKFADAVIHLIRENLNHRSLELVSVPGVGPLRTGTFTGISTIHRNGGATLIRGNDTVAFTASLDDNAILTSPCTVTFFGRDVCDGGATFRFRGVSFYLVFRALSSESGQPQLDVCDVNDLGHMTVKLGQADTMLTSALSWMGYWFSPLLKMRLSQNIEDALCETIAQSV